MKLANKFYLIPTLIVIVIIAGWLLSKTQKFQAIPQASPQPSLSPLTKTLSKSAFELKKEITKTDRKSGDLILEENNDLKIIYLISNDLFIVSIKTSSYETAKQTAESWFLNKGFSKEDLCNLKLSFGASKDIKPDLTLEDIIPSGCPLPTIQPPSSPG